MNNNQNNINNSNNIQVPNTSNDDISSQSPMVVQQINQSSISIQNPNEKALNNNGSINSEYVGKKRFPYTIVILLVVLISSIIFYYYFFITPKNVIESAFNHLFNSFSFALDYLENSEEKIIDLSLKSKLTTSGLETSEDSSIAFIDGLEVNLDSDIDLEKLNLSTNLYSNINSSSNSKMKYNKNLNIKLDYVDGNFYIVSDDKSYKIDLGSEIDLNKYSINYSKLNDTIDILKLIKNQFSSYCVEDLFNKSIVTKKVNNQTALAIKINVQFNETEIKNIMSKSFENLQNNQEFLIKWSNLFSISLEESKNMISKIIESDILSKNVELNLFMNLANTQLVGFDISVDDYYLELNYLNGFYYVDIKKYDNKAEIFNLNLSYDSYHGIMDAIGNVSLENQTYLYFIIDYDRCESSDNSKFVGDELTIKFYNEDNINSNIITEKPFCILECKLNIDYNNKNSTFSNSNESFTLTDLSNNEISDLKYSMNKIIYDYYFVYGKLMLNRKNNNDVNEYINDGTINANESLESIFKTISNDISYHQMLNLTTIELKEKINTIFKDISNENKTIFYEKITDNINSSLNYTEISKLEYEKFKELFEDKLILLDSKYINDIYDSVTQKFIDNLTYQNIFTMSVDIEKSIIKKIELLPSSNQNTIFNHINNEIKDNISYDKIISMNLDDEKILFSKINEFPSYYKSSTYKEIASIISSGINYDVFFKMNIDDVKLLISRINELPSLNIKTVLSNMSKSISDGITAEKFALLTENNVNEFVEKIKLLPESVQNTINNQIVIVSKEVMSNLTKYNVTNEQLLKKVCKFDNSVVERIKSGLSSSCK